MKNILAGVIKCVVGRVTQRRPIFFKENDEYV